VVDLQSAGWLLATFLAGYATGSRVAFREQLQMLRMVVREGIDEVKASLRPPRPPAE
jgi:hypothetical protein